MALIISNWSGRLGNNVLQIIRAIHYANINNYNSIEFPSHYAFISKKIIVNNLKNDKPTIINSFFKLKELNIIDPEPFIMKKYFKKYINPIFFIKPNQLIDNKNNLFIHIRSGDCFINPHSYYVPPPIYYYIRIIEDKKWDKIFVVYEDDKNPCINLLKNKNYTNIEFISGSLNNDLTILSHCQNLAIGFGTFGLLLYFLSNNIKNLYIPDYAYYEMPRGNWDININIIDLPNYIKCGEWKLTNENLSKVINYSI